MRLRNKDKSLLLNNNIENIENQREDMELYSSDFPCRKHPSSSSSVGICALCLKDRLVKLVCSDCGEQRLSSCSCSEISSNRNSCTVDVGSVGRVSFLIENERPGAGSDDGVSMLLRRSNSTSVDAKKKGSSGFWKLGRLFGRKKEKEMEVEMEFEDDRKVGVSRSRSLCSFRNGFGNGIFGSEDGGRSSISGARSSSVTACMFLDSGRRSGFSEVEPRKSDMEAYSEFGGFVSSSSSNNNYNYNYNNGAANRRVYSMKESDFGGFDDSRFIDLKLDLSAESEFSGGLGSLRGVSECGNGMEYGLSRGGSCRITVNDRGVKRGRKSLKGWRSIFKNQS